MTTTTTAAVLVTGASRGLGAVMAERLAHERRGTPSDHPRHPRHAVVAAGTAHERSA